MLKQQGFATAPRRTPNFDNKEFEAALQTLKFTK